MSGQDERFSRKRIGNKYQKKFFFNDYEIDLINDYATRYDIVGSFQQIVKTALFREIKTAMFEELTRKDSALAEKIKKAKRAGELIDILIDMGITREERLEIRKGLEQLEKWEDSIDYRRRRI